MQVFFLGRFAVDLAQGLKPLAVAMLLVLGKDVTIKRIERGEHFFIVTPSSVRA